MKKRLLSLLIVLALLFATVHISAATAHTLYWNQVGGGDIYWMYHKSITGAVAKTAGVHFNALEDFDKIILGFSTNGTNTLSLSLYEWNSNYGVSSSISPVWSYENYNVSNGSNTINIASPIEKGEYLLVIDNVVSHGEEDYIAIWTMPTKIANIEYYVQGNITNTANEYISGGITYIDNVYTSFGPINASVASKEVLWDPIGGGSNCWLYDSYWTQGQRRSVGIHFNALTDFYQFYLVADSPVALNYNLYEWKDSYDITINTQDPIWSKTKKVEVLKKLSIGQVIEKGEYLLVISIPDDIDVTGKSVSLWSANNRTPDTNVDFYANGKQATKVTDCVSGGLTYVDSSNSIFGQASQAVSSKEVTWGQIGGAGACFLYHDEFTDGKEQTLGVHLNALEDFYKISLGLNGGSLKLNFSLYSWQGSYGSSLMNAPVWSYQETVASVTSVMNLYTGLITKGEYLFLISLADGQELAGQNKAVWTFNPGTSVQYYADGKLTQSELETIAGSITYYDTSVTSLGPISTGAIEYRGAQIRTSLVPFYVEGQEDFSDMRQGLRFAFDLMDNEDTLLIDDVLYTVKGSGALVVLKSNLSNEDDMIVEKLGQVYKMEAQNELINWTEGDATFKSAYIYNIPHEYRNTVILARGFVKCEDSDGKIKYVYSQIIEDSIASVYTRIDPSSLDEDAKLWFK